MAAGAHYYQEQPMEQYPQDRDEPQVAQLIPLPRESPEEEAEALTSKEEEMLEAFFGYGASEQGVDFSENNPELAATFAFAAHDFLQIAGTAYVERQAALQGVQLKNPKSSP